MRTLESKVYTFNELSEEAKEKAINGLRDYNVDFDSWSEPVIERIKAGLENMGFFDTVVSWSGFGSQGDGASFIGRVDIFGFMKNHKISNKFRAVYAALSECDYCIEMNIIRTDSHYVHEKSTSCDTNFNRDVSLKAENQALALEDFINIAIETINRNIYKSIEKEYDYLTSDEAIKEAILLNEYEFTEQGVLI